MRILSHLLHMRYVRVLGLAKPQHNVTRYFGVISDVYHSMVDTEEWRPDPRQLAVVEKLDRLNTALATQSRPTHSPTRGGNEGDSDTQVTRKPKGLYLCGPVGCGKSMMMNLFFDYCATSSKQRVHFHDFVHKMHLHMHDFHYPEGRGTTRVHGDPIPFLVQRVIQGGHVLCFDEIQVTDAASAVIFGRLFQELEAQGAVCLFTSNRTPQDLLRIQRQHFRPFVRYVEEYCDIYEFPSFSEDYRTSKSHYIQNCFLGPDGAANQELFEDLWRAAIGDSTVEGKMIPFRGRQLRLDRVAGRTARFTFHELCEQPLGPADYKRIARDIDVVFLQGVPALNTRQRDSLRRFITLVDQLYEDKVVLITLASTGFDNFAVQADDKDCRIITADLGAIEESQLDDQDFLLSTILFDNAEDVFAFKRCISRLREMQSSDYLDEVSELRYGSTDWMSTFDTSG